MSWTVGMGVGVVVLMVVVDGSLLFFTVLGDLHMTDDCHTYVHVTVNSATARLNGSVQKLVVSRNFTLYRIISRLSFKEPMCGCPSLTVCCAVG